MSRTTYRLFDGTTRVSTAVKLKDGSILMVYPRMENFADVNLWKWVVEHEEDYVNSSLTLSTHDTKLSTARAPEPLSPYTPPVEPIAVPDPMRLGPTVEGIPYYMVMATQTSPRITLTPPMTPRGEFQEPLPSSPVPLPTSSLAPCASALGPSASVVPYDPCKLGPTAEGPGYDSDDDVHRKWLVKYELGNIQSDLATLARSMNERFNLMDIRIKALIKKLD
jgi:hypothetical protein